MIQGMAASNIGWRERFGVRSGAQVARDVRRVVRDMRRGDGFQWGTSTLGFVRPDLSIPAYWGRRPSNRLVPVYHLFDRTTGAARYSQRITRVTSRDYRGGRLTYDDHDGVDFVCPVGTPLVAAAPGIVVAMRDQFLRGGLTVCVDHGFGVLTQYTHCTRAVSRLGQPVARGEVIALSGVSGADMLSGFPWVPPHVHFSVWVCGQAVDPFLADGEQPHPGVWRDGNRPQASSITRETTPDVSPLDVDALGAVVRACTDERLRRELASYEGNLAGQAAVAEDALHHDRFAFPAGAPRRVRPEGLESEAAAERIRLTLPVPAEHYDGIRFADVRWTR